MNYEFGLKVSFHDVSGKSRCSLAFLHNFIPCCLSSSHLIATVSAGLSRNLNSYLISCTQGNLCRVSCSVDCVYVNKWLSDPLLIKTMPLCKITSKCAENSYWSDLKVDFLPCCAWVATMNSRLNVFVLHKRWPTEKPCSASVAFFCVWMKNYNHVCFF